MAIYKASGALFGKEVVTADGRDLGDLKDLEVEGDGWAVSSLVVRLNRDVLEEIHLKKPLVGSQEFVVASAHVASVSDKILLNKDLAYFARLTATEAPDAADD